MDMIYCLNKNRPYRILIAAFAAILFALSLSMTRSYANALIKYNKGSDTVIIGDSRAAHLYRAKYRDASFVASYKGRYGTSDKWTIPSKDYGLDRNKKTKKNSRYKMIKRFIRRTLSDNPSCKVVIMATINECAHGHNKSRYHKGAVDALISLAQECRKKVDMDGEKVAPSVTILSAPGARKGVLNKYEKKALKKYNAALKKAALKNKFNFIKLKEPKKSDFISDGVHFKPFKSRYNKYLWNIISGL